MKVTLDQVFEAQEKLKKYLKPTPLLYSAWLSRQLGCELYLKLETLQPIGSFKIRGATNRIMALSDREKGKGVVAASAGNHAQGVAWGAKNLGTHALIVMPKGAPLIKIQNTLALGASVELRGRDYQEAYLAAKKISEESGRVYIHAFEDPYVISGQGTIGLEILDQLPEVDLIIGSMGGGGMMAGISIVMKSLKPKVELIGCQASGADPIVRAVREGKKIKLSSAYTFADGIAVTESMNAMVKILESNLTGFHVATDEEIASAVLELMEKAKVVVEGAGALPLAVLKQIKSKIQGKKIVMMASGGNIDVNLIGRIIDRGLIKEGRRLRLRVTLPDEPGSLSQLTSWVAQEGANILEATHDRSGPSTRLSETEVALTLETKGPEHSKKLIQALEDKKACRVILNSTQVEKRS